MNCYLSGIIGTGLLGSSILTMMATKEQTDVLRKVLSPELAIKYEAIVKERSGHYIQGLILGMVISYFILSYAKITNRFHKISLFFAITLFTTSMYYLLMPKSDYMLNYLKTPEENKAWLSVYKTMKYRHLIGFVLGALAAVPIANSLC